MVKDVYYLQLAGAAMGSNVAPPYAKAFMDMIEQAFIFHCTLFNDHCTAWYRFIDDAFAIWTGDFHSLSLFNFYLNSLVPGLKFNMVGNSEAVPFLDTLVNVYTLIMILHLSGI